MRDRKQSKLVVAGTLGLGLLALVVGAPVAMGEKVRLDGVEVEGGGSFKPKKLPKKRMAPVKLNVFGKVRNIDPGNCTDPEDPETCEVIPVPQEDQAIAPEGSKPPITETITVDFDKQGTVYTKGLPVCRPSKIINRLTPVAIRKCGPKAGKRKNALIGRGTANAVVDFPDQAPFVAFGPDLLAFNGPKQGGNPTIIFHVFANPGAPTVFVTIGRITNSPLAGMGKRVTVPVPTIANDNGALTDFRVTINRKWKHKGKRRSYIRAKCKKRRLKAHARVEFQPDQGHEPMELGYVRKCKPKRR